MAIVATSYTQTKAKVAEDRHTRSAWLALIWGLLVAPIVISIIDPALAPTSDASTEFQQLGADQGSSAIRTLVFGINLLMLGVASGAIILSTRLSRTLNSGFMLWFGVMMFSAGPIIAAFFNTGLFLSPDVVRIPIFFTAAYLLPPVSLEWFVKQCKSVIELYVGLTLAAIVVAPRLVIQTGYDGSIVDALSFRLHGIANHVNVFAPMLVLYFVLGWIVPARTMYQRAALVVVAMTLLATQSKTAILAAGLLYIIRLFYSEGPRRYIVAYASSVAAVAGLLLLTITRPTWDSELVDTLIAENEYTTLTGRTDLWNYSLDLWREQPLLGYGTDLWYIEMTANHAARFHWIAHHAHNQAVQTLGVSGIIGLIGLTIFALVLLTKAFQLGRATKGVSIALVAFLFIRSITEVPLTGILDESLFVLWVTFTLLLLADSKSASGDDGQPAPDETETRTQKPLSARERILREIENERRGYQERQREFA